MIEGKLSLMVLNKVTQQASAAIACIADSTMAMRDQIKKYKGESLKAKKHKKMRVLTLIFNER